MARNSRLPKIERASSTLSYSLPIRCRNTTFSSHIENRTTSCISLSNSFAEWSPLPATASSLALCLTKTKGVRFLTVRMDKQLSPRHGGVQKICPSQPSRLEVRQHGQRLLLRDERHRCRVHAVTLPGRSRPVVENCVAPEKGWERGRGVWLQSSHSYHE